MTLLRQNNNEAGEMAANGGMMTKMQKTFGLLAVALSFFYQGCELDGPIEIWDTAEKSQEAAFTIRNESSYDLSNVTWSGVSFASPDSSNVLKKGTVSKRDVSEDAAGYIYFTCSGKEVRTQAIFMAEDSPVTVSDNTVVVDSGNNITTLAGLI
jgi:hypothetical protein